MCSCLPTSRLHCVTEVRVAHKLEGDIEHYEYRTHEERQIAFQTYGTSGLGLDLNGRSLAQSNSSFLGGL